MARKKVYNYPLVIDERQVNVSAFKKLAKRNGRSFNAEVVQAMSKHLAEHIIQEIKSIGK